MATDIEPSGMPATRFHDVYYGPVGSARFKYENVFMRFVAELTHSMGANVEYQTLQVEDILSAGVIYLFSILAGARGALAARVRRTSHRTA